MQYKIQILKHYKHRNTRTHMHTHTRHFCSLLKSLQSKPLKDFRSVYPDNDTLMPFQLRSFFTLQILSFMYDILFGKRRQGFDTFISGYMDISGTIPHSMGIHASLFWFLLKVRFDVILVFKQICNILLVSIPRWRRTNKMSLIKKCPIRTSRQLKETTEEVSLLKSIIRSTFKIANTDHNHHNEEQGV